MTEAIPRRETLPITRERPLDPPDELGRWREEATVRRMTYADGHEGWVVTGYAAARAILADPRFSNRPELLHSPFPNRPIRREDLERMPPGFFIRMDPPEHTRYRKLLTGQFTVRRMKLLEPRIAEIVADHLDAMERHGPPVDLVPTFALPIPSLVICELLGVPYGDRERFQRDSAALLNLETPLDDAQAALDDLFAYLHELVLRKSTEQGDDLLSGLISAGELTDREIAGMGLLLLIAGHETTANMLGLGTFALLCDPAQLTVMRDDPGSVENAVEELMRYLSVVHLGLIRAALEDVEIDGRLIRAGESVLLSLPLVNRDPERFADPTVLDLARSAHGHLGFGHGVHQCLGQQLARAEMRIAFPALLRRFPGLRLAVPPEEVPMRAAMAIYGVHRLPVAW
ncbi:cytochrome P450 [Sphaerimonospora cavernae]|uniref:Cytochrome P450 n=1 Tax=Sphaerimonospora cavernae TaxID=1740611 RepID=A0ABV6UAA2_9ACTN